MNRRDLQSLANLRIREAEALFRSRHFSGAYYLAGYALECGLKACIAKQFKRYDFPEKKSVNDAHTHDLKKLVGIARLEDARLLRVAEDESFRRNWDFATEWSETSRYRTTSRAESRALLDAIMEGEHGVLPWIKAFW